MYYESHHTFDICKDIKLRGILRNIAEDIGMKASMIDGDPLLGDKVYGYITTPTDTLDLMYKKWGKLESRLEYEGIPWIRRKIEHVIVDERKENEFCNQN
jgi:hypothetical protein